MNISVKEAKDGQLDVVVGCQSGRLTKLEAAILCQKLARPEPLPEELKLWAFDGAAWYSFTEISPHNETNKRILAKGGLEEIYGTYGWCLDHRHSECATVIVVSSTKPTWTPKTVSPAA